MRVWPSPSECNARPEGARRDERRKKGRGEGEKKARGIIPDPVFALAPKNSTEVGGQERSRPPTNEETGEMET